MNLSSGGGKEFDTYKELLTLYRSLLIIRSVKVFKVMETIDRSLFVTNATLAYVDSPMNIGHNATIPAPRTHAKCLELLKSNLRPGMRALDVGSGSGYLTACFAFMVGPNGRAVGVEHIPELAAFSTENIQKSPVAPLLERGSLSIDVGDGRLGWPECGPYDAIHVGAAAPEILQPLMDQLKPGGRLVIPVVRTVRGSSQQDLMVVEKCLNGSINKRCATSGVRYAPLTSCDAQLQGL
ncbi:hypothetical protein Sjap_004740 [Stephania japonica]|uniref:Protein-L-isoaspartate O-methyltransferase n=1 Tax=Stephania japonica TaxID=461633 RepID=A0AAP0K2W6_9MAGN